MLPGTILEKLSEGDVPKCSGVRTFIGESGQRRQRNNICDEAGGLPECVVSRQSLVRRWSSASAVVFLHSDDRRSDAKQIAVRFTNEQGRVLQRPWSWEDELTRSEVAASSALGRLQTIAHAVFVEEVHIKNVTPGLGHQRRHYQSERPLVMRSVDSKPSCTPSSSKESTSRMPLPAGSGHQRRHYQSERRGCSALDTKPSVLRVQEIPATLDQASRPLTDLERWRRPMAAASRSGVETSDRLLKDSWGALAARPAAGCAALQGRWSAAVQVKLWRQAGWTFSLCPPAETQRADV
ncbi:hypothetical protein THAOC_14769 [Thalassiosira oceanica]|uniref:Uncharacterized protein n=1 Tax=Thalassiosira oceanica TaxID=159749 RepID=K0STZ9_THAOC|nr:hypothetical protein THAOC_14769 [Thalassiosira oceanica]|eukprot:EJK64491.1 hypothetical protein THAOC_14769 [Thalassiosira oceanica]